jgi:GT2 family glycosyltransferase
LARERHRPHLPVRWNVVVACYNYGGYLSDCVRSVLANEIDCRVTIVDDGSTDGSAEIGRALADRYDAVDLIELGGNRGPSAATNAGIAAHDSVFVIRLDADDRIGPRYLRRADEVLSAGADIANPDAILFGDGSGRWEVPAQVSLPMLLDRNRIHCAAAFRRGSWAQVGGFDEDLRQWLDYDFWIRLVAAGARVRPVPGDHFYYRRHAGSLTAQGSAREELEQRLRAKHITLFGAQPAAIRARPMRIGRR